MSTTESASEPGSSENSHSTSNLRFSLRSMLIAVTMVAVIAGSIVFLIHQQQPWVELIGKDLIRTNASGEMIRNACRAVVETRQNWIDNADGSKSDSTFQQSGRTWSSGDSKNNIQTRVTRLETKITDKNSNRLSIESLFVTDTPTLIFVDYTDPNELPTIVNELYKELTQLGARRR